MSSQTFLAGVLVAVVALLGVSAGNLKAQEPTQQSPPASSQPKKKQKPAKATTAAPADPSTVTAAPEPTITNLHSEPTDLSGTYAGTFKCDDLGLTGDTTLTITGNEFSTTEGKRGRIVASTTKGYTAVALQLEGATGSSAGTIVSLRGRNVGDKLTLVPVEGATHQCSFTTIRNVASRRSRVLEPAGAAGMPVSNPAEVGPSPEKGAPSRTTRKKRVSNSRTTIPAPVISSPATVPVPTETPLPEQEPIPRPSPTPSPSPSPSPSPTASPSPTSSPTPSPSPTASPSPSPDPSPSPGPKKPRI